MAETQEAPYGGAPLAGEVWREVGTQRTVRLEWFNARSSDWCVVPLTLRDGSTPKKLRRQAIYDWTFRQNYRRVAAAAEVSGG